MKKVIAIFTIFALTILLAGCELFSEKATGGDENNNGPAGNRPPNSKYQAAIALDSYEELLSAWELNKAKGEPPKCYSFADLGENYQPVYYFTYYNVWTVYPLSVEDFFANSLGAQEVSTTVYRTENGYCEAHGDEINTKAYYMASDEIYEYTRYPSISIVKIGNLDEDEIIEIDDVSLLTAELTEAPDDGKCGYEYLCSYNGEPVFKLYSCLELTEESMSFLFEHVIVLK